MLQHLKEDWRHLKHGEPGQRFKDRYYLSQRRKRGRFTFWRVFNLGVGSGIALGGLLMVIAPGPGWLAIFLGLGMLGGEVLPVARFLDWIEVRLRKLVWWVSEAWNSTPGMGKALIVLAILTVVATSAYGAYHAASLGQSSAVVGELGRHLVLTGRQRLCSSSTAKA